VTRCNAAQTAELHAIPAFAEAMRARGFRIGDWVLTKDGKELLVHTQDCLGTEGLSPPCKPADCRLMASESDLWDYLISMDWEVWVYGPFGGRYEIEAWASNHQFIEATATTRLGALVAAVKAVEEVSDETP
jgi:hypothetical protein